MDRTERLAIEVDCLRLINNFNWYVDAFAYDDAIALFTPDGIIHRLDVAFEGEAGFPEGICYAKPQSQDVPSGQQCRGRDRRRRSCDR